MPKANRSIGSSGMSLPLAEPKARCLILGIGNPSRGDDALGPCLIERLRGQVGADVELLTDFQLQVEHVLDLAGRQEVLIADAAASGPAPYRFQAVKAAEDAAYTTHRLSPPGLLAVYRQYHGASPPACYVLAIRGYSFELGEPLSTQAEANLAAALNFLLQRSGRRSRW